MENLEKFTKYLDFKDYSKIYIGIIKNYIEYCYNNKINYLEITVETIHTFLLYTKNKGLVNGTLNNYIKALRCFYKFLLEYQKVEEITVNIINSITLLPVERKIQDFFSKEELEEIVEMGQSFCYHVDPYKLKALIWFLFYTGIRKNELLNIKRQDIDLKECSAIIRVPTKSKKERVVIFPRKLSKILQDYFSIEEEDKNAFNITIGILQHLVKQLKDFSPEHKNFTLHNLRHSFANMLAKNGIDIRVAQKLLGHQSLQSTLIYYDPDIEIIKKLYKDKIR